jgi:hypothetical protein
LTPGCAALAGGWVMAGAGSHGGRLRGGRAGDGQRGRAGCGAGRGGALGFAGYGELVGALEWERPRTAAGGYRGLRRLGVAGAPGK